MKIKKIEVIKNLWSFSDFKWNDGIPEFHDKWNIFYGTNGTGKTTLSELLRSVSQWRQTLDFIKKARNETFNIILDNGSSIKSIWNAFSNIKVFNREFVDDNVFCSWWAHSIIHIGSENIELKKQLEVRNKDKGIKKKDLENQEKQYKIISGQYELKLTEKAKVIREVLSIPTYNKINLKQVLEAPNFQKKELSETDLESNKIQSKQAIKELIQKWEIKFNQTIYEDYYNQIKATIAISVTNQVIDQLKGNIETRVKEGIKLHQWVNTCYFCNNQISSDYQEKLKQHFNQEYAILSNKIQELEKQNLVLSFNFIDWSLLYDEYAQLYLNYKGQIQREVESINQWLWTVSTLLQGKKIKMAESLLLDEELYDFSTIIWLISNINDLIEKHNTKTKNFEKEIQSAKKKVEMHYASEMYDDYLGLKKALEEEKKKIDDIRCELFKLDESISQLITSTKPEGNALMAINKYIQNILGRNDIKLILVDDWYKIVRWVEEQEFNPSEWEKTTIGFAYFLAKLDDQNTSSTDIVVFDDPITSLDEALLYRFYSIILSLKKYQVFLLTHHYTFFKKIIGGLKKEDVLYYRIKKNQGNSEIVLLEEEFLKYRSEYHFLFKTLYQFWQSSNSQQTLNIEDCYNYANMARKLIEAFWAIHAPKAQNIADKLNKCLSKAKIEAGTENYNLIYKFVNDYSHINSIDTVESFDISIYLENLPQVIWVIMDMIQKIDNDHFSELINC